MAAKYDYISLKNQYVQGTMSIRALCAQNDIPTWSTVNARAKREDWDKLRTEFQRQVENKSLEALAAKRAQKIAEIQLDALNVIHAGILKMAEDMDAEEEWEDSRGNVRRRKLMRIGPRDMSILIDKFQTLIGQPSGISENRNVNLGMQADLEPDELRMILAALRPQPALPGAAGQADRATSPGARTN